MQVSSQKKIKNTKKCRVCSKSISPFMTFGKMPIANAFLKKKEFKKEYFFHLSPCFCKSCYSFQLFTQPNPKKMFHKNYAFFSKTSNHMKRHFKDFYKWIDRTYLLKREKPFVVEIGSNDGILLENFAKKGIKHLGVEPSSNVANEALKNGVNTLVGFFGKSIIKKILNNYGKADIVVLANVMCHIPKINDVAKSISEILNKNGYLIFEDPYLLDMLKKVSYDQIYDEHVFMFSAMSVKNIFEKYGLKLVDAIPQETHGGSMRYVLAKNLKITESSRLKKVLQKEKKYNIHRSETYKKFKINCEISKNNLLKKLNMLKKLNKKVIGYAATSKSTTILNYCNIDKNLINFITDTTPIKQDTFSPGMHIPIKPYKDFSEINVDTAFLFAWNHKKEIMKKEKKFLKEGGTFLTHLK